MFELELAPDGFVKSVECYSRVIMIFWCAPQSVFCPKFLTRGIDSYIHILKKITTINFLLYKLLFGTPRLELNIIGLSMYFIFKK